MGEVWPTEKRQGRRSLLVACAGGRDGREVVSEPFEGPWSCWLLAALLEAVGTQPFLSAESATLFQLLSVLLI